jgi:hypothetical protein
MDFHQETQEEKQARWAKQRAARGAQQQEYAVARTRRRGKWLIVGVVVGSLILVGAVLILF